MQGPTPILAAATALTPQDLRLCGRCPGRWNLGSWGLVLSAHAPPPPSCFHGQQTWVGGPMLSVPWSQAFRLSLPGPQVQMKDHQRCPRQG